MAVCRGHTTQFHDVVSCPPFPQVSSCSCSPIVIMTNQRAKVLMVGPVNGQLRLLSDKLRTLQKSNAGPFDVCLCAGPFFHQTQPSANHSQEEHDHDEQKKIQIEDGKALVEGDISFDVPVLFVDVGDGPPEGLKIVYSYANDARKRDEHEIDIDDENDEIPSKPNTDTAQQLQLPDGMFRLAPNLYQLVGEGNVRNMLHSVADIISIPLPLTDPNCSSAVVQNRDYPINLTVGFLGPKVRLPCKEFEKKAKHPSYLGCDVLLSSEWGQGMSSKKSGALTEEDTAAIATNGDTTLHSSNIVGSYDVAELVAMSRPRYHIAPGTLIPISKGDINAVDSTITLQHRFVASLPYRYPRFSSSTTEEGYHAGRFLAMGAVVSPIEAKTLGKAFKFIHAVGIVPLAYMDISERQAAMELSVVVDCPYTDVSYDMDAVRSAINNNDKVGNFGLSEARARQIIQEDMASRMAHGEGGEGAYRWQQRPTRKRHRDYENGGDGKEDELKRQAIERDNPDNCSLFLYGLHRDPGGILTMDVLMDAFRPFGCIGVRFPKPKMGNMQQRVSPPSYAFLDFATHDEASQCLIDLNGDAVIRNIAVSLKWSSSSIATNQRREMIPPSLSLMPTQTSALGIPPYPPQNSKHRSRLTEAEAADSTFLFIRLPPILDSSSYADHLETMRILAQSTMEEELNDGVPIGAQDRITAVEEPALRVIVHHPDVVRNYGFLGFASHTAALTTLLALTGHEDGGLVSEERLARGMVLKNDDKDAALEDRPLNKDISNLKGVTLYWAKGGPSRAESEVTKSDKQNGLSFNKRHFPPDSRTDCWFCLASPTCEKHLIVAVYNECYVVMPKGAVNEFHALIVPVDHKSDGALVDRKLSPELNNVKSKLRVHARSVLQKDLFVFERCIQTKGGYHTHVQCIPVDSDSGPSIQSKMLEMAMCAGFQLKEITSDLDLNALDDDWSGGYFYAEIPLMGGANEFRRFLYRAGKNGSENGRGIVPLQFGRDVLAEVMGNPDISQWKACVVSQEKEEELTIAFRKSLSTI